MTTPAPPLARFASLKVKLGVLVAVSVVVTSVVATLGSAAGVPEPAISIASGLADTSLTTCPVTLVSVRL